MKSLSTFIKESASVVSKPWKEGKHNYRLMSDGKAIYAQRQFNSIGEFSNVPSGWPTSNIKHMSDNTFTLDGGQNWTVTVPKDIFKDFQKQL